MGAPMKPGSQLNGNDFSEAEKAQIVENEQKLIGGNERLKQGLAGLNKVQMQRLINKGAKDLYDSLSREASKSSALGDNNIHDLIDLANEYEKLKEYNRIIKKFHAVVFENGKFQANPAEKMRKDSLKEIDAIKTRLGMRAVDIATLARENADQNKMTQLKRLFADNEEE